MGGHPHWLMSTSCRCGLHNIQSSRFNLVSHVEVNADGREGHQVACLGSRFQIEFDVSFEPEWEEDCALGGLLVSIRFLIADCISPAASWLRMYVAVLLSLQTVQSGWGWEVLWCLLQGHFLYFWSYPEEVEQSKVGPACDV